MNAELKKAFAAYPSLFEYYKNLLSQGFTHKSAEAHITQADVEQHAEITKKNLPNHYKYTVINLNLAKELKEWDNDGYFKEQPTALPAYSILKDLEMLNEKLSNTS